MNLLSSIALALTLFWATPMFAENTLPVEEVLELESCHLLMLGAGILVGATLIAPSLGIGELVGVFVGAVGSEVIYRSIRHTDYWPFKESNSWFTFF